MDATMKNKKRNFPEKNLFSTQISHCSFFAIFISYLSFLVFKPELTINDKAQAYSQSIFNIKFCKQIKSKQI
jgi:hypothetical protein